MDKLFFETYKNWRHKFMYAFGPPGWSHDGSTLTIKQYKKMLQEEKLQTEELKKAS